jgi:pyruvate dehydrogenase E2 component (dihydrolipoamide acetyltransferase)
MKLFNLPDLGEGLPDAEIVEWHIKPGDHVTTDQLLVSMETAKAVVEVPSPFSGKIEKLFGQSGDVIKTGSPLVGFEADQQKAASDEIVDTGTIAGELERGDELVVESARVGARQVSTHATPAIRALARHLQVDLSQIKGDGVHDTITRDQVIAAARTQSRPIETTTSAEEVIPDGYKPLRGVRRYMAHLMEESTAHVTHVSLMDDVNIDAWPAHTDITARLLRAIVRACRAEPTLNAWYDGKTRSRKIFSEVNLGLAMDTEDGLFVPVIFDLQKIETNPSAIREQIQQLKEEVKTRTIAPEKLHGATITLSNFGNFAGRYATPVITPPQVAIIGAGKIRRIPMVVDGEIKPQRVMPLSLVMDHRAVTGGETTRFLAALMDDLKQPT